MIEDLKIIEKTSRFKDLLNDPTAWNTLDVNYHHPRVERLWTQLSSERRLMIHLIHPCKPGESLYHPHPWPSALHVLYGKYEMGLGVKYLPGYKELMMFRAEIDGVKVFDLDPIKRVGTEENGAEVFVKEICKIEMEGNNYYEMLDPKGWHYVRPIDYVCMSLMLIGTPFEEKDNQEIPKQWGKLPSLTEERKLELLNSVKIQLK